MLTTTDRLFVCRVWNKQLLVVMPKPGVQLVDVCLCVCAREYRCLTEQQGLKSTLLVLTGMAKLAKKHK